MKLKMLYIIEFSVKRNIIVAQKATSDRDCKPPDAL